MVSVDRRSVERSARDAFDLEGGRLVYWNECAGGRDDVEIDAVVFGRVARGGKGAEEFLTIQEKLFALVIERGEFGDAGEDLAEDLGAGMGASEFEGLFMEHFG